MTELIGTTEDQMFGKNNICILCGGTERDIKNGFCPMCGAQVSYGSGINRKEIYVHGTDHHEVSEVIRALTNDEAKHPFLILLANWTFWFGSLLSILGVVLVGIGATGNTEFTFFGQSFKSQNIGIASFFLGATIVVLNVRRLLKSFDA